MSISSYHPGELAAQSKTGTRGAADELAVGKRSTLNFSSNHEAFLAEQLFAVIASVNLERDKIWVTPLFGKTRDITALSESQIAISAQCIPRVDFLDKVKPTRRCQCWE